MNNYLTTQHVITKIALACFVPPNGGSPTHKNRPSHGLAFNCEGIKNYSFDDGTVYTVKKNDIIYLPKNSNYTVSTKEVGGVYCINFQTADVETFSPFILNVSTPDEILKAYKNAEKAWKRAIATREYRILSELYKIFYEMQRIHTIPYLPDSKQNLIKPALEYIHKFYTNELINMQQLSLLCGLSYDYFRKLFEKFYGYSPIKYINNLKLKRAKELLSSKLYSVSEAAYHSGFSDLSHFSRFFKKETGISPSEWNTQPQ